MKSPKAGIILLTFFAAFLVLILIPQLTYAQWPEQKSRRLCAAVVDEDWKSVHKQIKKMINQWSYLDTTYGYPSYSIAIDSMSRILDSLPCSSAAYADFCAVKISIWPGFSTIAVTFPSSQGPQEFCYHIQQGKMRAIRIQGVFYLPLGSKDKMVFTGQSNCPGYIEEQKQLCDDHNLKGFRNL